MLSAFILTSRYDIVPEWDLRNKMLTFAQNLLL